MTTAEIRETLEKQLQLLSERSEFEKGAPYGDCELPALTKAMTEVADLLNDGHPF